jgi:hypothetical protein
MTIKIRTTSKIERKIRSRIQPQRESYSYS